MERVREAVARHSDDPSPVLVRGEPGTGKSFVAGILAASATRVIDCRDTGSARLEQVLSDLPCELEGAPPVLRLEEIGDASRELQGGLLALLSARAPPVRPIATTSRDVERFARSGALLPEFLALFEARVVWLPPLRARRDDIPELVRHFLQALPAREVEDDALALLARQEWPGNVRQLRDAVRRVALLHDRITLPRIERELRKMRAEA